AAALGVGDAGEQDATARIRAALGAGPSLLVLDNFEHVLGARTLVADLLDACLALTVLVTSREPLHLLGEHQFLVPTLALSPLEPTVGEANSSQEPTDKVEESEAVTLFMHRARAVRPDFSLTAQNANAVAAICASLDGLPLAIELAAARVKLLPVHQLKVQIQSHRLRLLTGGPHDTEQRQRALRETIDWSYRLLSEDEQQCFRRLALFVGSWTLGAAEAICGNEALDLLASLIDKSLVQQQEQANGTARYSLLETIREFRLDRLRESGEMGEVARRHAAYYLALAEEDAPRITGSQRAPWLNRMRADLDNVRAALRWCVEQQHEDWSLRFICALTGAELSPDNGLLPLRVQALLCTGRLVMMLCDFPARRALCEEALGLARVLGDRHTAAQALDGLAQVLGWQGHWMEARHTIEECLVLANDLGDEELIARAKTVLGHVLHQLGDDDAAIVHAEVAAATQRRLGLSQLGWSLSTQGHVAYHRGDFERARAMFSKALSVAQRGGNKDAGSATLQLLGDLALEEGDVAQAQDLLGHSLRSHARSGNRYRLARVLDSFAVLAAAQAQPQQALRLYAAATSILRALGAVREPRWAATLERKLAPVRQTLGEAVAREAEAAGAVLTREEAIAEALAIPPESTQS
ncbi:MAG TPA: tetratricopeptide repeat protein, partial [Chloroflexota bacterium]|nr:tetratricopeptide repeat protein [Chloroflexota bacterium]